MSFFPVKNSTKPFWHSESDPEFAKHRTTPDLPSEVDVVIIGSGITGTSVAFHLQKYGYKGSILMLEARDTCSGATGRNGGHIKPYNHHRQNELVQAFGEKVAAHMVTFEGDHIAEVEKVVKQYQIDCDFERRTACDTFIDPSDLEENLADYYAFMNNPYIPKSYKDKTKILFGQQAEEVADQKTPACILYPTGSIWPYKFVCGLLKVCIDKGLNLQTNTLVTSLYQLQDDEKWLIKTSRGNVITSKVVLATNAYTKALLPEFGRRILPAKGVVTHIKPTGEKPKHNRHPFNYNHMFKFETDYLICRPDESIVVGGGGKTYLSHPNSFHMYNNVDDSYFLPETKEYLDNYMQKNYNSWKNHETINTTTWAGVMGYSNDDQPYVGELRKFGRPNVYISAGYTGHGMPKCFLCGRAIAKSIFTRKDVSNKDVPEALLITTERISNTSFPFVDDLIEMGYKDVFGKDYKL